MPEGFIYTRKSRALGDPDDDPAILAHQREALQRLAVQLGVTVPPAHVVEEIGSGERLESRVRLARLLAGWQQRPPAPGTVLMVTGVERVTRGDMLEAGLIIRQLQQANVPVQTLTQRFDLTKPDDAMLFGILTVAGNHQLNRNKQDVRLRKEELRRKGERINGGGCYGYVWDKNPVPGRKRGRLVPVPEEIAVVQKLFRDALTKSTVRLAQETGLTRKTVLYILHNPIYTGYPARHTQTAHTRSGKRSTKMLAPSEWPEQAGDYPAAITRAEFDAVQVALLARFSARDKTGCTNAWCRDRLFLEEEPAHVVLGRQQWFRKLNVPIYKLRVGSGPLLVYPRAPIHAAADAAIRAALTRPSLIREAILAARNRQQAPAQEERETTLRAALSRARTRLTSLKLAAADDPEDRLALLEAEQQVKREITALKEALAGIDHRPPPPQFLGLETLLDRVGDRLLGIWETMGDDERRGIAADLLGGVHLRVTPGGYRRKAEREILAVRYADWLAPFMRAE